MRSLADTIIYEDAQKLSLLLKSEELDCNEVDEYGLTPLVEAAITRKVEVAKILLNHGAEVNLADTTGHTPLHWATDSRSLEMVKLLLERGADPNTPSRAGQSPLVLPLLRHEEAIAELLQTHGASLYFAEDFMRAKLLAHQFELKTKIDIVNPKNEFLELNLEGFLLESTVAMVGNSLRQYANHFSGRKHRSLFSSLTQLFEAFSRAIDVMRYQHFSVNAEVIQSQTAHFFEHPVLVLPIAYRGHAIGLLRFGDYLAKCDRGAYGEDHGTLIIYKVLKPELLTPAFFQRLLFQRTSEDFVHHSINKILGLVPLATLPLPLQLTGNCTWANIEGLVPAFVFFMLNHSGVSLRQAESQALNFFQDWSNWDKDRTLSSAIQEFHVANAARKASLAALLAAVLFQCCRYENQQDYGRALKIVDIFRDKTYQYVLKSYLAVHFERYKTHGGRNLHELLDMLGLDLS